MKKICLISLIAALVLLISSCASLGGSRHERKMAVAEQSGQATAASGGETFQTSQPFEKLYEKVVNFLKIKNETIETADQTVGQIITAMTVSGGWRQTGTRIQITLIKENDTTTQVRVVVTEQKRYKLLQTEPWGDAKVNQGKSADLAKRIKAYLESAS
jgi:hypothetical protein